jgi:hypothetical protein
VTGLVVLLMILIGAACGFALFGAGLQPLAIGVINQERLPVAVVAIVVTGVIVVSIISSALSEIFRFDNGLLQNAFDGRTRRR